jgi:hypothetical protein
MCHSSLLGTGQGSPGKRPLVIAVETDPNGRLRRMKLARIPRFKRRRVKSLTKRVSEPGSTVVTNGLSCFRGVADAGCIHVAIPTGSGRRAARHPAFRWVNTTLGSIKNAILATFRAVRARSK